MTTDGSPLADRILDVARSRTGYRGDDPDEALTRLMSRIDATEADAGVLADAVLWAADKMDVEMPRGAFLVAQVAPAVALACGKPLDGRQRWARVSPIGDAPPVSSSDDRRG
jgi:hypothetical protein